MPAFVQDLNGNRAVFDIRTRRLCRRILFFYGFAELPFSPSPCLVRSLDLAYQNFQFDGAPHPPRDRWSEFQHLAPDSIKATEYKSHFLYFSAGSANAASNS